jgi:hypothetical protein
MLRSLILAAGLVALSVNAYARCRHPQFDGRSWRVVVTPQYGAETNVDVITFADGKMTSSWLASLGYQPVSVEVDHNSFEGRFARGDLHIRYKGKWKKEAFRGEVRLGTHHSDTARRWRVTDAVALAHAPAPAEPPPADTAAATAAPPPAGEAPPPPPAGDAPPPPPPAQ